MLAIAGGKGGVGKTTVALGLARALARAGRHPLVADADVDMPDLHVVAGVARTPTADRLAAGDRIERVVQYPRDMPGVGVVTAGRPRETPAALRRLGGWHGPVIVDCPAGASGDAARPLRACDRSVLVTTDTPEAIEDTRKTAAVARRLDADPVVTLVRGDARVVDVESPVEPLPTVEADRPQADPRVLGVCGSVLERLGRAEPAFQPRSQGR